VGCFEFFPVSAWKTWHGTTPKPQVSLPRAGGSAGTYTTSICRAPFHLVPRFSARLATPRDAEQAKSSGDEREPKTRRVNWRCSFPCTVSAQRGLHSDPRPYPKGGTLLGDLARIGAVRRPPAPAFAFEQGAGATPIPSLPLAYPGLVSISASELPDAVAVVVDRRPRLGFSHPLCHRPKPPHTPNLTLINQYHVWRSNDPPEVKREPPLEELTC
jgi:hypothetical protein